jgi:hypothetical protein
MKSIRWLRSRSIAAVVEIVVLSLVQRVDADGEPAHAGRLELGNSRLGQQSAVGADDHRRTTAAGVPGDDSQVLAQQWLAT